jgi:hypothetical protein
VHWIACCGAVGGERPEVRGGLRIASLVVGVEAVGPSPLGSPVGLASGSGVPVLAREYLEMCEMVGDGVRCRPVGECERLAIVGLGFVRIWADLGYQRA